MLLRHILELVGSVAVVTAQCYDPSPAFPVPTWQKDGPRLDAELFSAIETELNSLLSKKKYDTSSLSVEVTTSADSVWSFHYTAREKNVSRPGVAKVDGKSLYRIASISKVFTTLAILYQHSAGNLSINGPVNHYIEEFARKDSGALPWKDVTLRALASQIGGLPREFAQSDFLADYADPSQFGLPPASREVLPPCYHDGVGVPCNRSELIDYLLLKQPLFAPNQKSDYSNINFILLGLVIENVTGLDYSTYIQKAIFEPLGMTHSSLSVPSHENAVLPMDSHYWDIDIGVRKPTGGIYSCTADLSIFVRYILGHYNALVTGLNWLLPVSWSGPIESFYGMPFEIFRTDRILQNTRRPVTFVTKAGGHPGYYSKIVMMPEYGLGFTILTAGSKSLLGDVLDVIGARLTNGAEDAIWRHVDQAYTGSFVATEPSLNSSLEITSSPSTGLVISSFISNGTDVVEAVFDPSTASEESDTSQPWRVQLIPTLLFKNEEEQQGMIWRALTVPERQNDKGGPFDGFCISSIDPALYANKPLNEVVFWSEKGVIELPAWNLTLKPTAEAAQSKSFFESAWNTLSQSSQMVLGQVV